MPTIKTTNGKIVLKNGKASCSCCEAPSSCCMYPAEGLYAGYEESDLPDTLSATFYDGSGIETIMLTRDGTTYKNGGIPYVVYDNSYDLPIWAFLFPYVTTSAACLVASTGTEFDEFYYTVEDQFAAEYVFTGIGGEPDVTVSRVSLCVWSGVDSCGNTWYLTYGVSGPIESGLEFGWNAKPWSQFDCNFTEPFSSSKTGDQNTPVGSYDGTASVTVSEVP